MSTRTSLNFWIDVASLAVMIGLAATGGLIHFVLPAGSGHFYALCGWDRHDIGQVHFYLAVAAIALLALHVLLHWSWVCCIVSKAVGREAPSRRARTAWGGVVLLAIVVFLVGGLWWASSMVQELAPGGRGQDRRAHVGRGSTFAADPGHETHLDECPAGAAIDGRTSLGAAATMCGLSVAQLLQELALPASIDPEERLGRLKRRHGLDLLAVRELACRWSSPRSSSIRRKVEVNR